MTTETTEYQFDLPTGPRTYRVNTEVSPALLHLVREHYDSLKILTSEADESYGVRLYEFFTATPERFNSIMRMALYGDHTNVDFYWDVNVLRAVDALVAYWRAVFPKVIKTLDELAAREDEARAEIAAAREAGIAEAKARMDALAAGTPVVKCSGCGALVKKWVVDTAGKPFGYDCECAKDLSTQREGGEAVVPRSAIPDAVLRTDETPRDPNAFDTHTFTPFGEDS